VTRSRLVAVALLAVWAGIASAAVPSAPPERPLLDKSIVAVPTRAGRFTIGRSSTDRHDALAGVRANYHVAGAVRGPTIIVRAIPRGRVAAGAAVSALATRFERGLRGTPGIRDLVALPRTRIDVELPGASLYHHTNGYHTRGFKLPEGGLRQSFTYMDTDGVAVRTAMLVFHRRLFDIQVRVGAAASAMSQAEFDALADEAARTLVPALDIRNFGRCANRQREDNCAGSEAGARWAAPVQGVAHALVYPPGALLPGR
jgi:hypothetical protein